VDLDTRPAGWWTSKGFVTWCVSPQSTGRRPIFIVGILVFALASLLGGFATDQAWLLAARAAQGVGAAMAAPTALSLVAVTFPEGPPRNRAMGVYAAMSVAGLAVGLTSAGCWSTTATGAGCCS
jgi:MFS family permease